MQESKVAWEERYIMLLWLSHLLLTPFDLASISSVRTPEHDEPVIANLQLSKDIPWSARFLAFTGLTYLGAASKVREAAVILLVRLSVRPDLYQQGLMLALINRANGSLLSNPQHHAPATIYQHVGTLAFLNKVLEAAGPELSARFIPGIYATVQQIVSSQSTFHAEIRSSALARKALVKLFQTLASLSLSVSSQIPSNVAETPPSVSLEDVIDYLLAMLGDKDTPVRLAAGRAIASIALRLDHGLAREVIRVILDHLGQDLPVPVERDSRVEISGARIDYSAVNPLRWHGLVLALAHLLLYRSPPLDQLPEMLEYLLVALQFEQKSSTATSIGANVRDAACLGIWALSRKYTTAELLSINVSSIRVARFHGDVSSIPQVIAAELVAAACLDPIGNLRRAASAALQELIGRHPETVRAGISIVQVVDYHAVSLRSNAIAQVGVCAARLDTVYRNAFFQGLLGWRGVGSTDSQSRRNAASGIGLLCEVSGYDPTQAIEMMKIILETATRLPTRDVDKKHGMLLSIAAILDATSLRDGNRDGIKRRELPGPATEEAEVRAKLLEGAMRALDVSIGQNAVASVHSELLAEAACRLISSTATLIHMITGDQAIALAEKGIISRLLERCTAMLEEILNRTAPISERIQEDCASAAKLLFAALDGVRRLQLAGTWLKHVSIEQSSKSGGTSIRAMAHLNVLGVVYDYFGSPNARPDDDATSRKGLEIVRALLRHSSSLSPIEIRLVALNGLEKVIVRKTFTAEIIEALSSCLDDYTTDSRGDVGSLIRLKAIEVVAAASQHGLLSGTVGDSSAEHVLISRVARLSAEKIDKVRLAAVICLHTAWSSSRPSLVGRFSVVDSSIVCSYDYFRDVLQILHAPDATWCHAPILVGLATSAGAGSPSVLESSRRALLDFAEDLASQSQPRSFSLPQLFQHLTDVLQDNLSNDRVLVPALGTFAFLLDSGVATRMAADRFNWEMLVALVQKAHVKSRNVPKLEAVIKVYAGLALVAAVRDAVLRKLTLMLSHPFPTVRIMAAEALYIHLSGQMQDPDVCQRLARADWSESGDKLSAEVHLIGARMLRK
ncbi:MAG: hypothetical protein M1826_001888 [Phylliscum demangeonii]|nr:MAG: hypothetical protein M1826_001888 [Phylliscum demangeonii]